MISEKALETALHALYVCRNDIRFNYYDPRNIPDIIKVQYNNILDAITELTEEYARIRYNPKENKK